MKRLQFAVQDELYDKLENLRERTQAASLSEVFRDALRAYAWIVSEFERNREVVSRPVNQDDERVYSSLERAVTPGAFAVRSRETDDPAHLVEAASAHRKG